MNTKKLYLVNLLLPLFPATRCFSLKRMILRWAGAVVGQNVRIVSSAKFHVAGNMVIGNNTWIGDYVLIVGGDADVIIGSDVDIGPKVIIVTGTHELFTSKNKAAGAGYSEKIIIEDGAWICAASTILAGVTIGRCSIVGAGSVVNRSTEAGGIYVGVPAKKIK